MQKIREAEARLTATPATMRSSASSSVLRTDTAFASLPFITQESSQPGTALNDLRHNRTSWLCRRSTPDAEEETDCIGGHGRCSGARSTGSDSISEKDADTQIWSLERTENEPYQEPPDPVLDTVSQLVSSESREWTGSSTELAEAVNTGMAANALTKYLNVKSGRLLDEYHEV